MERAGRLDGAPAGAQTGQRRDIGAVQHGRRGGAARNEPAGRRPSRRSRTRVDGRTKRAAGRAAYLAAMLCSMGRNGTGSTGPRKRRPRVRISAASGASAPRSSASSISRSAAAPYRSQDAAARARRKRVEVRRERAHVAAGHRPGQGRADPERPGVAERPLDQRAVDRQRAGLVQARRPGRARRWRRAGPRTRRRRGPRRRGRRPCAPGASRTGVAPIASAMSASSAASWSSPSIATVAPWSAATARSVSAKATSGWNEPTCVPAAMAGSSTSAPSAPLVWTIAWPPYRRSCAATSGAMTSSGTARMTSSTSSRSALGLGERARARPRASGTARGGRRRGSPPRRSASRPGERDAERRPDRARADDPDERRLPRSRDAGGGAAGRVACLVAASVVRVGRAAGGSSSMGRRWSPGAPRGPRLPPGRSASVRSSASGCAGRARSQAPHRPGPVHRARHGRSRYSSTRR